MSRRSLALWALVALGVVARTIWLDSLPGLNGDEAWYGVQVVSGAASLRTPTGNLVNPLHLAPLALLQPFAPLAPWVLRAPALLAGLVTLALGHRLLRRSLGPAEAACFTALAASSPDLVAYARLGWDASGTPLASLVALHLALSRRWVWAAVAAGASLVVHPTNALLAAPLGALLAVDLFATPSTKRRGALIAASVTASLALGALVLAAVVRFDLRAALGGLAPAPGETFATMLSRYGDLLTGVTVYRYIAGPVPRAAALAHQAVFWALVAPAVALGCARAWRDGERRLAALAAGLAASLVALYAGFGTFPLTPGSERYGQFLVVPSLVLVAWSLSALWPRDGGRRAFTAAALASVVTLACVGAFYFRPLRVEGGRSHRTFRIGAREPKVMVADAVRAASGSRDAVVLAEDWWTGVPLEYLLARSPRVRVLRLAEGAPAGPAALSALRAGAFVVGWHGGAFHRAIVGGAPPGSVVDRVVYDRGRRPLLHLWRLRAP